MRSPSFTVLALLLLTISVSAEVKLPDISSILRGRHVVTCIDKVSKKHNVRFSHSPSTSFIDVDGPNVDYRGFSKRGVCPLPKAARIDFTSDLLRSVAKSIAELGGEGGAVTFYSKPDTKINGRQELFRILYRRKNVQGIAMITLSNGSGDKVNIAVHVYEHRKTAGLTKP